MGLASKIKNAQQQQPGGSAPSYDYPPPQQHAGSYEASGYGAAPAPYAYPPQQPGAPSAPPDPQQHYGGGYAPPREHPVQSHPQSYVETPYGVQGHGEQGPPPSSAYGMYSPDVGAYMHPAPGGLGPPQHTASSVNMYSQKLQSIIQANGLQSFYDQGRFQATLQKVAAINFSEIAAQWKISIELAYDLAPLALYDIMFYCDDSGSMAFEENGERIDDLKFILSKVSGIATKFDDDGIRVRFMNSDVNGDGIHSAADVEKLISNVRFRGMTPLGTNLDRKIIQPFVLGQAKSSNMAKPVLAIIITDGEPSGEDRGTIREVIQRAKDSFDTYSVWWWCARSPDCASWKGCKHTEVSGVIRQGSCCWWNDRLYLLLRIGGRRICKEGNHLDSRVMVVENVCGGN